MAILKAGLSQLTDEALVAKADFVTAKLVANIATFPTPIPSVVTVTAAKEALRLAIIAAEDGGRSAHSDKRIAKKALKDVLVQVAEYVAQVAAGDETTILDGGFEVRKKPEPAPVPAAPVMVDARTSDYTGKVELDWKGKGARFYQVYVTNQDPATTTAVWTKLSPTTKSRYTVEDLVSGGFYWFRVVAVNAAGESPFSDVIMGRAA